MAEPISAAALVDTMIRISPASAPILGGLAEGLASGAVQMPEFCSVVRKELGDTILLEALLMMQGVRVPLSCAADAKMLVDRAARGCTDSGCAQISFMLSTIRAHCLACAAPEQCRTCQRWSHLCADAPVAAADIPPARSALPAAAGDAAFAALDAVGHSLRVKQPHKDANASPALLMLARSALGDITTSPGASRCNSPTVPPRSPKRGPAKRAKASDVSALSKIARCSAATDAPTVVRAASVVHATPMRMGPIAFGSEAAPPRLAALPMVPTMP